MPKYIHAEIDAGTSTVLDAYLNYYKPNPTEEEASNVRDPMLDMVNKYLDIKTDPITKVQSLYDDWFAKSTGYNVEETPTPRHSSLGLDKAENHAVKLTFPSTGLPAEEQIAFEQKFGRLTDKTSSSKPKWPRTFSSMEAWHDMGGKQSFAAQLDLDYASGDFESFHFTGMNEERLSIMKDKRPGSRWQIEYTDQSGRFSGTQNLPDQIKVPVETFLWIYAPEALESSQDPSSTQTTATTPTILQDDKPATQPSNLAPTATDG